MRSDWQQLPFMNTPNQHSCCAYTDLDLTHSKKLLFHASITSGVVCQKSCTGQKVAIFRHTVANFRRRRFGDKNLNFAPKFTNPKKTKGREENFPTNKNLRGGIAHCSSATSVKHWSGACVQWCPRTNLWWLSETLFPPAGVVYEICCTSVAIEAAVYGRII